MFNPLKIFKRKIEVAIGPSAKHGGARGFVRTNKNGERETVIIGEKFPIRGHSNPTLLVTVMKRLIKEGLKAFADSRSGDIVPQENLKMPVRVLAEVLDELIEAENHEVMKEKGRWLKKALVPFLEEDDAYCFRYQLLMERLCKRIKEIKLSKADKYYFHSRSDFDWKKFE